MTALFVVLCIEQYKNLKNKTPFLIGAFSSILAIILVPSDKMLVTAIISSLILLFIFRNKIESNE